MGNFVRGRNVRIFMQKFLALLWDKTIANFLFTLLFPVSLALSSLIPLDNCLHLIYSFSSSFPYPDVLLPYFSLPLLFFIFSDFSFLLPSLPSPFFPLLISFFLSYIVYSLYNFISCRHKFSLRSTFKKKGSITCDLWLILLPLCFPKILLRDQTKQQITQ